MTNAFIHDTVRTPHGKGKKSGTLHSVKPINLTAGLSRAVQRCNGLDTTQVDDIVLGCVTPVNDQGVDIARTTALVADWDKQVVGVQISRFCASGLGVMDLGTTKVRSSLEGLILVGGVEPMSHIPMGSGDGAWALDPETSLHTSFILQEIGADLIAALEGSSRADVDASALRSQQKAAKVHTEGLFDESLMPVTGQNGIVLFDHDESIHVDSTLKGFAALKPSFEMMGQMSFGTTVLRKYSQIERIEHVHTPGNNLGIVDDASAMLIGSEVRGRELGLKARARIVATTVTSTDLIIMFTGPASVIRRALAKADLEVEDIDLFEVNEALTSVVMKFMKDMGVAESRVSVSGGTVTTNHPPDATSCIILDTLLDELGRHNLHCGLATLCIDGGMGIATIIERV